MIDGLHGWPQTRADGVDVVYTTAEGDRRRLRFEPGETDPWELIEDRWDYSKGKWVPVGFRPVREVHVDGGRQDQEQEPKQNQEMSD